jgi:hypothetical protein
MPIPFPLPIRVCIPLPIFGRGYADSPTFSKKTEEFRAQKVQAQQTESEAKSQVNNRSVGVAEEGALVVKHKCSTSSFIMQHIKKLCYKECVCITPQQKTIITVSQPFSY